jgi:hypothetical protein
MTDQPDLPRLLHLADRGRRGVALDAEHDALTAGIQILSAERNRAEGALDRVRAECEAIGTPHICNTVDRILAALNHPKEK